MTLGLLIGILVGVGVGVAIGVALRARRDLGVLTEARVVESRLADAQGSLNRVGVQRALVEERAILEAEESDRRLLAKARDHRKQAKARVHAQGAGAPL